MTYKLFLCDRCEKEMRLAYSVHKIILTDTSARCEKCGKKRYGARYEVRK